MLFGRAVAVLLFRRPAEFSAPRASGVAVLWGIAVALLRPAEPNEREEAGGVMRLTVGRENAACDGRTLAEVARAPSMLSCVGVAFTRFRADAPLNWPALSLTEFPATARPLMKLLRDIARPAVEAYCGNPPCAP